MQDVELTPLASVRSRSPEQHEYAPPTNETQSGDAPMNSTSEVAPGIADPKVGEVGRIISGVDTMGIANDSHVQATHCQSEIIGESLAVGHHWVRSTYHGL